MEPAFKRDQEHNYMVLESPEEVQGSEYQVRMLLMNKIPGLLECRMRILDGRPVFYYEITSRQPLTRIYEKTGLGVEGLRQLLGGLHRGMESFGRYLLDVNDLILNPEYIYVDPEQGEVFLCCLPFYQSDVAEEFRSLAEYILKHLDHGSEGAVLWGYEIYSRTARENYSLEEILKSIYRPGREKSGERTDQAQKPGRAKALNGGAETGGAGDRNRNYGREENSGKEQGSLVEGQGGAKREKRESDREKTALEKRRWKPGRRKRKLSGNQSRTESRRDGQKREGIGEGKNVRVLLGGLLLAALTAGAGALLRLLGVSAMQTGGILCLILGAAGYGFHQSGAVRERERVCGDRPGARRWAGREVPDVWEEAPEEEPEPELEWDSGEAEVSFGETTALTGEELDSGALLQCQNPKCGDSLALSGKRQVIGKLSQRVDLVIASPGVSRIHARIERKEEGYYLADLNSKNGTFVNGVRLEGNENRRLADGDRICFGDVSYFFKDQLEVPEGIHYNEEDHTIGSE